MLTSKATSDSLRFGSSLRLIAPAHRFGSSLRLIASAHRFGSSFGHIAWAHRFGAHRSSLRLVASAHRFGSSLWLITSAHRCGPLLRPIALAHCFGSSLRLIGLLHICDRPRSRVSALTRCVGGGGGDRRLAAGRRRCQRRQLLIAFALWLHLTPPHFVHCSAVLLILLALRSMLLCFVMVAEVTAGAPSVSGAARHPTFELLRLLAPPHAATLRPLLGYAADPVISPVHVAPSFPWWPRLRTSWQACSARHASRSSLSPVSASPRFLEVP